MLLPVRETGRAARALCIGTAMTAMAGLVGCQDAGTSKTTSTAAAPAASPAPAASLAGTGDVLATYSGKKFTVGDYRDAVGSLNARACKSLDESPDRRKQFVENHIIAKLIFAEGVAKGFDKDPVVQQRLADLKEQLVVQRVMEEQQNSSVTDDEVKAYYDSHVQEFSTEKVKASHILVEDEALAKEIYAKLQADKTQFEALAAEHSKDLSNAKRGGDLGAFGRGRMVKEFEETAFSLQADGDISEPIKTRFGWHIILRSSREDGVVQPYDQVKSQIKVKMVNEGRREKTTTFLADLKTKSALSIEDASLAKATCGGAAAGDDKSVKAGSGH